MKNLNTYFRLTMVFMAFVVGALVTSCEEEIDTGYGKFEPGLIAASVSDSSILNTESITFVDLSTKVLSREWSFPNGTPSTSTDSLVTVSFTNPTTAELMIEVLLTITHFDNTKSTKTFNITLGPGEATGGGGGGGGGTPLEPLNIAFITDDLTTDQGYIDLLASKGHTVEAEAGKYNNLDASGAATLNGFDLIIISRNTNSGNFSDGARPAWTTITKPVLNLSSFVARSTRLHYFPSENQNEAGGTSIKATDTSHPVFTNVTLDADGLVAVTEGALHVVVGVDAGNGTLIGTTADGANAAIAYFEPGAAYAGADSFAGKRMFLSGTGGGYTYNEAGAQLFLNCVEYVVTGAVYSEGGTGGGLTSRPLNIAFITDDVTGDQGYIDLLVSKGHTVEAEAGKYNNLDASGASTLNGFDLVIISRNTNSGNFSDGARPAWTTVSKPVLNLSSFVARSTRLHYFPSENQNESGGTTIKVLETSHPIFTNVTLDADGLVAVTAGALHVVVGVDAGNGTLIGTTADGANAAIAFFEPGAAYAGADSFAGKRMFLAGTGGGYTYNEAGAQLFINCVDYIAN